MPRSTSPRWTRFPASSSIWKRCSSNPAATICRPPFSPELADLTLYVIDVSAGDKIPRKGGPGITRSDLLIINKIDLAPYVGASLEVMDRDARKMRGARPFIFSNLKDGTGLATSSPSSSNRAAWASRTNADSFTRRRRSDIDILPTVARVAADEPDTAAKTVQPTSGYAPGRPGWRALTGTVEY